MPVAFSNVKSLVEVYLAKFLILKEGTGGHVQFALSALSMHFTNFTNLQQVAKVDSNELS